MSWGRGRLALARLLVSILGALHPAQPTLALPHIANHPAEQSATTHSLFLFCPAGAADLAAGAGGAARGPGQGGGAGPQPAELVRKLIWFHHIKNPNKRKNIVAWAHELQVGALLFWLIRTSARAAFVRRGTGQLRHGRVLHPACHPSLSKRQWRAGDAGLVHCVNQRALHPIQHDNPPREAR
jgi:hypothetical protein